MKEATFAETQIRISDLKGLPISGAIVSGQWSGVISSTASATTDEDGIATVRSSKVDSPGPVSFRVNTVTKSGTVYDPTKNKIEQVSIVK